MWSQMKKGGMQNGKMWSDCAKKSHFFSIPEAFCDARICQKCVCDRGSAPDSAGGHPVPLPHTTGRRRLGASILARGTCYKVQKNLYVILWICIGSLEDVNSQKRGLTFCHPVCRVSLETETYNRFSLCLKNRIHFMLFDCEFYFNKVVFAICV